MCHWGNLKNENKNCDTVKKSHNTSDLAFKRKGKRKKKQRKRKKEKKQIKKKEGNEGKKVARVFAWRTFMVQLNLYYMEINVAFSGENILSQRSHLGNR